jgi:hypothetical protein
VLGSEYLTELKILTPAMRRKFADAVATGAIRSESPRTASDSAVLAEISAAQYLRYCRVCYEAAFRKRKAASHIALYRAFSDGRHGGLLNLPLQSSKAFRKWYASEAFSGCHPFEIVRDSILLFVQQTPDEPPGYWLRLGCRRRDRIDPHVVRMALGLVRADVPFVMENAPDHATFVRGDDWLGVAEDAIWERGAPVRPAESGILNTMQNSVLLSEIAMNPQTLKRVRWFTKPAIVQPF